MAQIKDLKRMCAASRCGNCPLYGGCSSPDCFTDDADEIVDNWVKEHPAKTYAMDFFEKFPNARKNDDGIPTICAKHMYDNSDIVENCNTVSCYECWNQEMKGDE